MLGIFSTEPVRFPEGFLWGSATAGHQIEGKPLPGTFRQGVQLLESLERGFRAAERTGASGFPHVDRMVAPRTRGGST